MTLEQIYYVSQTVAVFGILGSLFYLGIQVRNQNTESRHRTIEDLTGGLREWTATAASNPELTRIWFKGVHDFARLEPIEKLQFAMIANGLFRIMESLFIQHRDGRITEEMFEGYAVMINDFAALPGIAEWWATRRHWFQQAYRERIDDKIRIAQAQGIVPSLYGEGAARQ